MPLLHRCSVCGSWFEKGATEPDADGEPRRAWGYEVTAQMAVAMADALESGGPAGSLHGAVPKVLRAHRERCGAGAHPRLTAPGYEKLIEGEGMPLSKTPAKHGMLKIHFKLNFPKYLAQNVKDSLRPLLTPPVSEPSVKVNPAK